MSERTRLVIEALGHWLLAWALVVLAVSLWAALLRPRRASVRYAGWLLATFAGAALLPAVVAVGPRVSWREIFTRLLPGSSRQLAEVAPTSYRSWFADIPARVRPGLVARTANPEGFRDESVSRDERLSATAPIQTKTPPNAGDRWLPLALGAWLAGFLVFGARLIGSSLRIRTMRASLEFAVPKDLEDRKENVRRDLGIRRQVRIGIHPEIVAPMCVGLFRPTILWPTSENCPMNPGQRLASLTHEMAHLRHGDDVIALLAELWRALAWFFLPVHFTMLRLHREREYRCDDLAARTLDTPEDYACWLLDLAPVSVKSPPPLLAASLLGRTSLAERIGRIARGELRWSRPLGRRSRAVLIFMAVLLLATAGSVRLIGFEAHAQPAEPADAPLPPITPKDLASRIREAMKTYPDRGTFRVVFSETRDTNWKFNLNRGTAEEQKPILVTFNGRAKYESDGRLWRAEYDSMTTTSGSTRLTPDRWSTGFDGVQLYDRQVWHNQLILGEEHFFARNWTPRGLFWERAEELISVLENPNPDRFSIAIKQRVVDGSMCYVIEGGTPGGEYAAEYVVAPRRGYLPIRRSQSRNGKKYVTYDLQDLREVVPGIWAPQRIEHEWLNIRDDGKSRLELRRRLRVAAYHPDAIVPPAALALDVPSGIDVIDRRSGHAYHNDPWWPEIGAMLREKYDWPKLDLSPLVNLGSPSPNKLDNQPAPPLRVASWLNSEPRDLAALRGKVVLLVFWNIAAPFHRPLVPALKQLYATYHPAGLEMIAIHSPAVDPDELSRFVKEYGITYPVAIDVKGPQYWGATADSYGTRDATFAFLIDREGKVHSVGTPTIQGGKIAETLLPLLKEAGASDPKPISLETPRLSNVAIRDCDQLFQKKVKEALDADPVGRIHCHIVDDQGHDLAGAKVRASLQLTLMMVATPGANQVLNYRQMLDRLSGTTGPDGQIDLRDLCKGTYIVKVEAPGRAWVERKVILNPQLDPASVDIVLKPGLAIGGLVQDEKGQPIRGAILTASQWEYEDDGRTTITSACEWLKPAKSVASGQFRFTDLPPGRYTFDIEAPGFQPRQMEKVPASNENVAITLNRPERR